MGKTDYAYEYVKAKIINGEYPPLSDISEDTLQKEMNVSRTPVREAILRLEKEDFVYVYPRKGTIVTAVTLDLIEDIYGVRELVEPPMVLSAMHQMKKEVLLDLRRRFLEVPEGLSDKELRRYYIDLDTELHSTIVAGCPNRYLRRLLNNISDQNLRLRIISSHPTEGEGSIEEHLEIIDLLLAGDKEKLEKILRHHLQESKDRTIRHFRFREPMR